MRTVGMPHVLHFLREALSLFVQTGGMQILDRDPDVVHPPLHLFALFGMGHVPVGAPLKFPLDL